MKSSEQIDKVSAAFVKAQAMFPPITRSKTVEVKTRTGGSYSFAYAPLDAILALLKPVLAANGLAILQSVRGEEVSTMVLHESGQWFESDPTKVVTVDSSPQSMGAGITYSRRFSLSAFLNLASEDDTDADMRGNKKRGSITPTTGALDAIAPERRERLERVMSAIVDCYNGGMNEEAYRAFAEVTDNDERVALWELLKPHSKVRSAVKAAGEALRKRDATQEKS